MPLLSAGFLALRPIINVNVFLHGLLKKTIVACTLQTRNYNGLKSFET